jgi:energy-coupling factor transport system permease protein
MSEFEFQRRIAIGQYMPTDSPIHRLDPRTRLVTGLSVLLALSVTPSLVGLLVGVASILLLLRLARVPLRYGLSGLKAPLPFITLLALIQVLFAIQGETGTLLWTWGPIRISTSSLHSAATLIVRFSALVLTLSLLSTTLSTTELLRGLRHLLRPLSRIGVPTHDLVLMVQIALRFVPLLADEAERIAKSQASRGANWGTGRGGPIRRTKQVLPMLLPLFLTSLERAEAMALAIEARGYRSGETRTSAVTLRYRAADALAVLITLALITFIIVL